jgi:cardiolipin synthase
VTWLIVLALLALAVIVELLRRLGRAEKTVRRPLEHRYAIAEPQFRREMSSLFGPTILDGNRVTALHNGEQIFPAMLDAIRSARRTITFETYIYWSGDIGAEFTAALEERARAGVRVHLTIDWAGSIKLEERLLDRLRAAGAEVVRYRPLSWYHLGRLNNRTHRKLLVIDGELAFTGGVGIADQWLGHAQDPDHWRDVHFRLEGPAAAQFQTAFSDNWIKSTGRVLSGPEYFPELRPCGPTPAQLFVASPAGGSESMHLMFLLAINAAVRSIDLTAAYFVPDRLLVRALVDARRRGVRVRLLLPGPHIDSFSVRIASKGEWGPLLEAGIEVHLYQPTMLHTKRLVLDEEFVSVGSTNVDLRSFRLNDEASLNLYDRPFARAMAEDFERDLTSSRPYTLEDWQRRPLRQRLAEKFLAPLKSQL